MNKTILPAFLLYLRLSIVLIILTSVLAAIIISIDISGLKLFASIFNLIP